METTFKPRIYVALQKVHCSTGFSDEPCGLDPVVTYLTMTAACVPKMGTLSMPNEPVIFALYCHASVGTFPQLLLVTCQFCG